MDQPMSDRHFHCMTVMFKVRDLIVPRRKILDEVDLRPGQTVLDFACGPGAYIPDAASRVGPEGSCTPSTFTPWRSRRSAGSPREGAQAGGNHPFGRKREDQSSRSKR